MKKKMIFAAIAVVALISGAARICLQGENSTTNALALANVEALSRWEFPNSWKGQWDVTYHYGWHHCEADGPDDCPGI